MSIQIPPPQHSKLSSWNPLKEDQLKIEIDALEARVKELERKLEVLKNYVNVSRKCNRS